MKEHGIPFSDAMVRALVREVDPKINTRRVIVPQPSAEWQPVVGSYHPTVIDRHGEEQPGKEIYGAADENEGRKCPYGQPGDRLWVREALHCYEGITFYSAHLPGFDSMVGSYMPWRWQRKSLLARYCPRWASRFTLEVVSVRVERVQEISEADALAEGCEVMAGVTAGGGIGLASARYSFCRLWDSINAKRGYSWAANPWVWVVEFKRVQL